MVLGLNTEMLGTGGVSRKAGRILGKVASATGGSEACVCCSEQGNVSSSFDPIKVWVMLL